MRLRLKFSKTDAMRYTGHLDLHRSWERTMRRARLPLAYSQGFRPHLRLNLACALPLGFTSQCEVLDVWLDEQLPLDEINKAIQRATPPGIALHSIDCMDERLPSLQTQVIASEYSLILLDPISELDQRIRELCSADQLLRRRRNKEYDLRPLVLALHRLPDDENGCQRLHTRLSAREGDTGRPEELILALGGAPERTRVHRTHLLFIEPGINS